MPLGDAKRRERRKRILNAVQEFVGDVGFENVTMHGVAEAAGVTAPTLYNTFGSKDELLYEAVLEHYEELLEEAGPANGVRGLERVIATLTATAESMAREPNYVRMLMHSFETRPGGQRLERALNLEGFQVLVEAMKEMRADGELQDWVDPTVMASLISGVRRGVTLDWAGGRIAVEDLTNVTVFAACVVLAGASTGEAAEHCRRIAKERQRLLPIDALKSIATVTGDTS